MEDDPIFKPEDSVISLGHKLQLFFLQRHECTHVKA